MSDANEVRPPVSPGEMSADDREVQAQTQRVNEILRQLEAKLDNNQHAVVTELLAERAVLGAMRAQVELQDLKKQQTAGTSPVYGFDNVPPAPSATNTGDIATMVRPKTDDTDEPHALAKVPDEPHALAKPFDQEPKPTTGGN
jgi:hypothetical protein